MTSKEMLRKIAVGEIHPQWQCDGDGHHVGTGDTVWTRANVGFNNVGFNVVKATSSNIAGVEETLWVTDRASGDTEQASCPPGYSWRVLYVE